MLFFFFKVCLHACVCVRVCESRWRDGAAREEKRDGDGADGRGEISERGLRHVKPSSHS